MADFSRRSSRTTMRSKPLGQLLVESGDVTNDQISQALKTQEQSGGLIGAILQNMGAVGADAIGQALSKQIQVTDVQCEEINAEVEATKRVTREFCLKEKVCAFELLGNLLCVVMVNPLNRKAISDIEGSTRLKVKAFKAPWPKVSELIERGYAPTSAKPAPPAAKHVEPLEDLSFELHDEPVSTTPAKPAPVTKSVPSPAPAATPMEDEPLEFDDIIIPPTQSDDQPAGPTGILEISSDTIPLPSHAAIPAYKLGPKPVQPPLALKIKGIESLDSGDAELVETTKRKTDSAPKPAPKKAAPRVAKVNIDLDKFDLSEATETIDTHQPPEAEAMEEIQHSGIDAGERSSEIVLVALKTVPDSYFYAGNAPKNAPRSDELMDIIEALPVAQVVAESITEYERKLFGDTNVPANESGSLLPMTGSSMAGKARVDLQRAPATPMAAIRLGEGEFVKLTLQLTEDDSGEWEWSVASPGPVPVDAFED